MRRRVAGFTLVELLVVIVIITILAAIVLPAVNRSMQQARRQQALAEMQQLASIITQVYSEVGYYVRLEDLVLREADQVRRWGNDDYDHEIVLTGYNLMCLDDNGIDTTLDDTSDGNRDVSGFWSGPYTTFKHYVNIASGARPLDPWGRGESDDVAVFHQYRMFWIGYDPADAANYANIPDDVRNLIPAGARGTMIIISPGPDGRYSFPAGSPASPEDATADDFAAFRPSEAGDDIYFAFNAGIQ